MHGHMLDFDKWVAGMDLVESMDLMEE
jgi:hypothetical protein